MRADRAGVEGSGSASRGFGFSMSCDRLSKKTHLAQEIIECHDGPSDV
jgi:hypothetical protein